MIGDEAMSEIELTLFWRPYSTLEAELRREAPLARVLDLIEAGFKDATGPINPRAMAKAAALSKTALNTSLRRTTGFAPHQFLLKRRVLEAARLIHRTDSTLLEIAQAVGFANIAGLERNFKRLLNRTPSALRQQRAPKER